MPLLKPVLALIVAVLVAATTVLVSWSEPSGARAAARTSCGGNLIFTEKLRYRGVIGELDLYWNPDTKRNCAIVYHLGRTRGKKLFTEVSLIRCNKGVKKGEDCGDSGGNKVDSGHFRYQAGPVSMKAAHRCVFARAEIKLSDINSVSVTTHNGPGLVADFCN